MSREKIIKSKSQVQGLFRTSYSHFGFRNNLPPIEEVKIQEKVEPIIRASFKDFDPFFETRTDINNQLLQDEQNEFDFYKIAPIDKMRLKKKKGTEYKSKESVSDKALLVGTKLFQNREFNVFEKQARSTLKKEGTLFTLSEIYQYFDQELENRKNSKNEEGNILKNLDQWTRKNQQEFKRIKEVQKIELEKQRSIELENQILEQNQKQGQKKVQKDLNQIQKNIRKSMQTLSFNNQENNKQEKENKNQVMIVFNAQDSQEKVGNQQYQNKNQLFPISQQQDQQQKQIDQKRNSNSSVEDKDFKQAIQNANKMAKQRKSHEINQNDTNDVQKQIQKYIKEIPMETANSNEDNQNPQADQINQLQIDISPENVNQSILLRFSLNENLNGIKQKSKFFEKQSSFISTRIENKLKELEILINNKMNTSRLIRMENHSYLNKIKLNKWNIQQYKNQIKEFAESKNRKKSSTRPTAQQVGSNEQLSEHGNSEEKAQKQMTAQQQRLQQINLLMTTVEESNKLEDSISILQNQNKDLTQKINENSYQINSIDQQLIKLKKDFKDINKSQIIYYFTILHHGQDVRNTGLSWIVIILWNLGQTIKDSDFPAFLDQKCREFILQKSKLEVQLKEMNSLLSMQMDIYKKNVKQKEFQSSQQQDSILFQSQNNDSQNINQSSLPSINVGQIQSPSNCFSQIDIDGLRLDQTLNRRKSKFEGFEENYYGLSKEDQQKIDKTINEANRSKLTTNDIYYNESRKKIKEALKVKRKFELQMNDDQSDIDEEMEPNNNLITENNANSELRKPIEHNIALYENSNLMNKYETKEEFFKQYDTLKLKIELKEKELKNLQDHEIQRIIKEFDLKNYAGKFKTDSETVLSALFGTFRAEREIIRNGLRKKN